MSSKHDDPLNPDVYSNLINLVPVMLEWLRERSIQDAAITMKSAALYLKDPKLCPKVKPKLLNEILLYLAAEVDKGPMNRARRKRGKTKLPPSNFSLSFLMVSKATDLTVWYVIVLKILRDANPRIIPKSILQLKFAEEPDLPQSMRKEELGKLNNLVSRDFSTKGVFAFAELCSFIRDSLTLTGGTENLKSIANAVGRVLIEGENNSGGNIMQVCIRTCYSLFQFLPQKNYNLYVRGCRTKLPVGSDKAMVKRLTFDKLRKDLVSFFEFKDSSKVSAVPLLMSSYSIYELALGLVVNYQCLPLGWKEILVQGKGKKELDWFSSSTTLYVDEDQYIGKHRVFVPRKALERYESLKVKASTDELNRIVDELVQKKYEYVKSLESFFDDFVSEIKFIAESEAFGTEAKNALGIGPLDIEKLMGSTLKEVLSIEQRILADLECLRILPCEVKQGYKRGGLLCKVLLKHREGTVKAYTAYGISYEKWEELLKTLLQNANKAQGDQTVHLHFVDLYSELRTTNLKLGSSIDVVLQNPIGYLTKIPLYLERMKKHIEKKLASKHPSYKLISESLVKFRELVQEVNKGIGENQEKLQMSSKGTMRKKNKNFLPFASSRRKHVRRKGAINLSAGSFNES